MTSRASNLTYLRLFGLFSCWLGLVVAGPRYIAIPIDGVDVIELNPVGGPRISRHAEAYGPIPAPGPQQPPEPMLEQPVPLRPERATAHILDYVDFGGHTGPNGAFSWYADYPSHH
ncbi:PREDICTED: uncharacterized protein LOC105369054 [Ceratosolen solmsi marchali]|uniref:Uncharacterized protein LOC105369054 n=1 Tax=Ceratosolen solmsi marchali TaxID=326594 RepID=A0AAJ6YY54_9HYME|nr:PREDICTED: uncharacterized protein LOC105369054 [Ceratosolen solmsi marchali]